MNGKVSSQKPPHQLVPLLERQIARRRDDFIVRRLPLAA